MKALKILLIGVTDVCNYGCEAIVRGTAAIIRKEYPSSEIIYTSRRPMDDQKRLNCSPVRIIETKYRRYSFKNIIRKLLSMVGINWTPQVAPLSLLKGVDIVLSIGGDMYTLISGKSYSTSLIKFGDGSEKKGVPYILWGASVGPFSENAKAEAIFKKHLKGISLITAREPVSVQYLYKIGVSDNVVSCADPAYVVAPEVKADTFLKHSHVTIGINLSPLSARCSTRYSIDKTVQVQSSAIQKLIKTLNARIILIPHVVSDFDELKDDLRYLHKIKQMVAPEHRKMITLIANDPGFIGIKKELIKCDLVIAARMHCAINALAAYVPTILISYSQKAVGMCQYVYNNGDWVIPLDEFAIRHVLERKVRLMLNKQLEIRTYLSERIPEIQQDAYQPASRLKKILEDQEASGG